MILVDANLLLYAEDSLSEHHQAARTWWDAQLSGAEPDLVVDLASLGADLLDWSSSPVAALVEQVGDADLVVVNKPPGLLVIPDRFNSALPSLKKVLETRLGLQSGN